MSQSDNVAAARAVLQALIDCRALTTKLSIVETTLHVDGWPALEIPAPDHVGNWRATVNRSLLPASVSPESRRHLLYAVLQDFVHPEILLREDTNSARPLEEMDSSLAPFDDVYRVPATSGRHILFPIHIAVPTVFDTYGRRPGMKPQTDKGFRGTFVEFFSTDEASSFDPLMLRVLRDLFARTEGLTPLDKALVRALGSRLLTKREPKLRKLLGEIRFAQMQADSAEMWKDLYKPLPDRTDFRPLHEFAEQGRRLQDDVVAIALAYGPSRIERVSFVERLFAYHFSLYMVRLTRVLYRELDWVYQYLWRGRGSSPWSGQDLVVKFHGRQANVPREHHAEYDQLMDRLNEAFLLLPVLNNIELAIRAVASSRKRSPAARISDGQWCEAKQILASLDEGQVESVRNVLTFLSQLARHYADTENEATIQEVVDRPVDRLFEAVQRHYSAPDLRRYPKNHHQTVFDSTAGSGPTSFVQRQPHKHIVLGDELIYLLVLAMFERRRSEDRRDSTVPMPREANVLRRRRLPLREFEERLDQDLLVPADDAAREGLRTSLARLGLLDRLSDVGEGNFLRHPIGI